MKNETAYSIKTAARATYGMRYQTPGFCGPASIVNCFRALGRKVPLARVGALATCTAEKGAPPDNLIEAIRALGFAATKMETTEARPAWEWIYGSLELGRPVIILTQDDEHYVAVVGLLGKRVIVVDSTNTIANKAENGTHVYSKREFMKRWMAKAGTYFGISISKK